MGIFKAGLTTAAGACALAMVVGHGSLGKGFSRLGSDLQATYASFKPEAQRALGLAGHEIEQGTKSAKAAYAQAPQALNGMQAAAKAAAVDASAKAEMLLAQAKQVRPLDSAASSALSRVAAQGQSSLRRELFGERFEEVDPRARQAAEALLSASKSAPSLEDAKLQSLRELGAAMLESSPTLRAAALGHAGKQTAPQGKAARGAQALAAAAFCDSFASALAGAASPEQAHLWGLPSAKALREAGLPEPEAARARWRMALGSNPVNQALEIAAREASKPDAWRGSSMAKELGSERWLAEKTIVNAKSALGEAQAHQGSAFIFAAAKLGAPGQDLANIRAKIQAKRAVEQGAAPTPELGSPL